MLAEAGWSLRRRTFPMLEPFDKGIYVFLPQNAGVGASRIMVTLTPFAGDNELSKTKASMMVRAIPQRRIKTEGKDQRIGPGLLWS